MIGYMIMSGGLLLVVGGSTDWFVLRPMPFFRIKLNRRENRLFTLGFGLVLAAVGLVFSNVERGK